jgi:hypothetical protein
VAVSDSIHIESSGRGHNNWFPPPWFKGILFIFSRNSVPFRASKLALPRNTECDFLSSNNGNRSESILRNVFGTIFSSQPYTVIKKISKSLVLILTSKYRIITGLLKVFSHRGSNRDMNVLNSIHRTQRLLIFSCSDEQIRASNHQRRVSINICAGIG